MNREWNSRSKPPELNEPHVINRMPTMAIRIPQMIEAMLSALPTSATVDKERAASFDQWSRVVDMESRDQVFVAGSNMQVSVFVPHVAILA